MLLIFLAPYKKKDIRLLIKHYMVEKLTKEELKKLRRSAKKFLNNNKISYEDKIEILFGWYDKLDLTGQISIPLYDEDARLMQVKDKGQIYKKSSQNREDQYEISDIKGLKINTRPR